MLESIRSTTDLSKETEAKLKSAVNPSPRASPDSLTINRTPRLDEARGGDANRCRPSRNSETGSPPSSRRRRSPRRCRWSPSRSCAAPRSAVEAARPYAQRVEAVLTNLAGASTGRRRRPAARRIRIGPDPPARRLHGRARAVRRVQHRDRALWRATGATRLRRGQDGQDHLRRQEGLRPASPHPREADPRADRPARRARDHLRDGAADRREDHRAVRQPASSTSARCSTRASGR